MFRAWAEGWQEFMRSPEFLAAMTKSLEASLKGRQQWAEQLGQMQQRDAGGQPAGLRPAGADACGGSRSGAGDSLEQIAAGLADLGSRLQKLEEGLAKRSNSRVRSL